MAALGLTREDLAGNHLAVWPDNWPVVLLMQDMDTQWRIGGLGIATGLDYAALPLLFDLHNVAPALRRRVFADLRVMEIEVLNYLAEKHKGQQ